MVYADVCGQYPRFPLDFERFLDAKFAEDNSDDEIKNKVKDIHPANMSYVRKIM